MYHSIVKVTPLKDFTLKILFDNNEEGIIDMKPYLDLGVFQKIKDYESFQKVSISFDTVEWECGIDLDPEFIYDKCMNKHAIQN